MAVLVTGGAGYIGSHVIEILRSRGESVVIVDDLVTGVAERIAGLPLLQLNLADDSVPEALESFMREHAVDSVIHFAGRKQVPESVEQPAKYYRDNVGGMANLLLAMERAGVSTLVFSSSAAVYGEPEHNPVSEDSPTSPINPYGRTKLIGEQMLHDAAAAGWLRAVSLRYFNVAGAANPLLSDRNALNLVPMVIEKVVAGEAPRVFGTDYATPDGTCIRDFIHVVDLAEAHLAALDQLRAGKTIAAAYNVGTGTGASVLEVIEAIGQASGQTLVPQLEPRRPGDPAVVVADVSNITNDLGWSARLDISDMATSAWDAWLATHNL